MWKIHYYHVGIMLLLAPKYDKSQFYPTLFALEKENKNPDSLFHVLTECIH